MAFVTVCGSSSFTPRVTLQRTTCLRQARFTTRASIEREVSEELKVAMKARDSERVKALRTIRAAFLTALKAEGAGDSLSDREAVASLRKLAKMREESIEMFRKGGRDDLVQAEQAELAVIEHWLPNMASEEQVTIWVKDAISKTGASKPGDMGKVMGAIMKDHREEVDGNVVRKIVSEQPAGMAFVRTIPVSARSKLDSGLRTVCQRRCAKNVTTATPRMSIFDGSDIANAGVKLVLTAGVLTAAGAFLLSKDANAAIFHFSGERPSNLGVQYGRYLNSCPPSPNCVSSSANVYDKHYVPSWTYNNEEAKKPKKTMQEAVEDLKGVLSNFPRVTIVENKPIDSEYGTGHYIYAEFESKIMGFVDDVEFYFRPDGSTVEYRSASRIGEGDFDVNRKRIRDIRVALQDSDKRWASTGY